MTLVARLRLALCLTAVLLAFGTPSAWAREWFVAVDGKDAAAGTKEQPTSLFSALDRALARDTIIMRGGQYQGAELSKRMVFLEKEGLTLRAAEGERPVISIPIEPTTPKGDGSCIIWFYAPNCTIEGLELVGSGAHCVKMEHPKGVVRNCKLHGCGADAVKIVRTAPGCLIEGCEIYDTGKATTNAEGIDNVAADDVVVRGNYIHHIMSNGLYMKGGARNCLIEGNLVTDCNDNGIMLGQSTGKQFMTSEYECRDSIARNNIVMRTKGSGLAFEAAQNCQFYNNTLYDVAQSAQAAMNVNANSYKTPSTGVTLANNVVVVLSGRPLVFVHPLGLAAKGDLRCDYNLYFSPSGRYPFWYEPEKMYWEKFEDWRAGTGYDEHSLLADPKLDTAGKGKWGQSSLQLLAGSPAIDIGLALPEAVPTDFLGTPRPQGKGFDLGACEVKP
jgi:hypothetical protein